MLPGELPLRTRRVGCAGRCAWVRTAGAALLLAGGVIGCERLAGLGKTPAAAPGGGASAPVPVLVAQATHQDMPVQVEAIGWVESFATVRVRSRVDGQLTEIRFDEGQSVKAGEHLFTIDPRPFQAALLLAEANLARDQALAEDARKEFEWVEDLFKQGTATQRERDRIKARMDSTLATVRADQAAIENARLQLEYCTIKSPIDARAGDRLTDVGNMVKANDTLLVTLEQVSPIHVSFSVAEQHIDAIRQYMQAGELAVEAVNPADAKVLEIGVLTFMDSSVDRATGTIRLKGTYRNEGRRLWPGQYVNVRLRLAVRRNQVVVPTEAVQTGQRGQFVFVIGEGGKAEVRPVVPGESMANQSIISEGLAAGEVVVTDGQLRLTNGAKVQIKNPASAPAHPPVAAAGSAAGGHEGGRP